jgi:hypothetical protein
MLGILFVLLIAVVETPFIGQVEASNKPPEALGYTPPTIIIVEPMNIVYTDFVPLNVIATGGGFDPNKPYMLWDTGYSYSVDGAAYVPIAPSAALRDLATGNHSIVVEYHYSIAWGQISGPYSETSEPAYFSVINTNISIQEPQNKTYNTNQIALNVTIDKPVSILTYSIDNKSNKTITGNTTLPQLPDGSHQITIYADETLASQTIHFTIKTSTQTILLLSITAVAVAIIATGIAITLYKKSHHKPNQQAR